MTFAGVIAGRGVLVLSHAGGLRSSFEPVSTALPVGSQVATGQAVATLSGVAGHCAPTSCLHWGVRRGEVYLDPLTLVGPVQVVLVPASP